MVEVQLSDEKDLLTLCWVPLTPNFKSLTRFDRLSANIAQDSYNRGERGKQDKKVEDLRVALQTCSPSVRRDFWNVFNHLGDLDSLYPVRQATHFMTFCGTTGKETRIEENEIPRPNATEPEGGFKPALRRDAQQRKVVGPG